MSRSVVEAYKCKYEDEDESQFDSKIKIVFVKRKNFKLCNLVLDNCNIAEAGPAAEVSDICSSVIECDLAHNKLADWKEVYKLLDVGPNVKFLNLSNNVLGACDSLPAAPYTSLQCLVLSGNGIEWQSLLSLLTYLPALSNLNIGHNNISSLPAPTTPHPSLPDLTELNLIHNAVSSFPDVASLAELFPNLHTLVLSDNPLNSFGEDQQLVEKFEKMRKLHVNNITINSWEEVSKLRWFPALNDVRMVHWDLFGDMNEEERRKMLGVLLPNTHLINGAPIDDRDAAERWYMRRCKIAGDTEGHRYQELFTKYGELPEVRDITLGGQDETITLLLCVPEKGVEVEKTFSIYDSYKFVASSLETEIKEKISLRFIDLYKSSPSNITPTASSDPTATASDTTSPLAEQLKPVSAGKEQRAMIGPAPFLNNERQMRITQPRQMLYQIMRTRGYDEQTQTVMNWSVMKPESGDSLHFKLACTWDVLF